MGIVLRGFAMGAADVVPGVSGGTIAFISGIYEEFINAIRSVNLQAIKTWQKEGFKAAWNHINGNFLVALFLGIGTSIVLLAHQISRLLEHYPVLLWSFFFGLIVASVLYVGRTVKKWEAGTFVAMATGAGFAFWITTLTPSGNIGEHWYIILSGAIAVCAMILPGISGSFILVLLGSYQTILTAIDHRDLVMIGWFGLGCIIGLLAFSHVLSWLFRKYHNLTIALLTGFLIGSLNKIWPWKEVVEKKVFTRADGEVKEIFIRNNVLPQHFDGDPQLLSAILLGLGGLALIFLLEFAATRNKKI